jgi:hypothetical protein
MENDYIGIEERSGCVRGVELCLFLGFYVHAWQLPSYSGREQLVRVDQDLIDLQRWLEMRYPDKPVKFLAKKTLSE